MAMPTVTVGPMRIAATALRTHSQCSYASRVTMPGSSITNSSTP